MEVEEEEGVEGIVSRLLDGDGEEVLGGRRVDVPELLHRAGEVGVGRGREGRRSYTVLCGKAVGANPCLASTVEPWLARCGAPWEQGEGDGERRSKRRRVEVGVEELAAALCLLQHCPGLRRSWSWEGLFALLPSSCQETRFLTVQLLALLFHLPQHLATTLCTSLLGQEGEEGVAELVLRHTVDSAMTAAALATDRSQEQELGLELRGVARVGHLSLPREGEEGLEEGMVEVGSTVENLVRVAGGVAVGQAVLLVGEAGVGKTSVVRELARRTGRTLLTLQVHHSLAHFITCLPQTPDHCSLA